MGRAKSKIPFAALLRVNGMEEVNLDQYIFSDDLQSTSFKDIDYPSLESYKKDLYYIEDVVARRLNVASNVSVKAEVSKEVINASTYFLASEVKTKRNIDWDSYVDALLKESLEYSNPETKKIRKVLAKKNTGTWDLNEQLNADLEDISKSLRSLREKQISNLDRDGKIEAELFFLEMTNIANFTLPASDHPLASIQRVMRAAGLVYTMSKFLATQVDPQKEAELSLIRVNSILVEGLTSEALKVM